MDLEESFEKKTEKSTKSSKRKKEKSSKKDKEKDKEREKSQPKEVKMEKSEKSEKEVKPEKETKVEKKPEVKPEVKPKKQIDSKISEKPKPKKQEEKKLESDDEEIHTDDEYHQKLELLEQEKIQDAKVRKRQEQAKLFEQYLEQSGMTYAFEIIFTEIISKQIREDQVFAYTAMRLRQIGRELDSAEKTAVELVDQDSD